MDLESQQPIEQPQQQQEQQQGQETLRKCEGEEYLRRNKVERCQYYGIQIGYFSCFLVFGIGLVMTLGGKNNEILKASGKSMIFFINQMVFFIVLMIQQAIRNHLIRGNYDFFERYLPKILIMTFTTFFFMQNIVMLLIFIGNIANTQFKSSSQYKQLTQYITIENLPILCIIIISIEVILGFYNHILLTFVLRRRMQNTLFNRILAQPSARNNKYLPFQQYIQSINNNSQTISQNNSQNASDIQHCSNSQCSASKESTQIDSAIKSDLACNLIQQKDFKDQGIIEEQRNEEYTCCICQVQIQMQDKAIYLPCKHLYHSDCLTFWLINHRTCPFCRQPI